MPVVALEPGAFDGGRPVFGRGVAQQLRVEQLRAGQRHDLEQAVGRGQHHFQVAQADPHVLGAVLTLVVHHVVRGRGRRRRRRRLRRRRGRRLRGRRLRGRRLRSRRGGRDQRQSHHDGGRRPTVGVAVHDVVRLRTCYVNLGDDTKTERFDWRYDVTVACRFRKNRIVFPSR